MDTEPPPSFGTDLPDLPAGYPTPARDSPKEIGRRKLGH